MYILVNMYESSPNKWVNPYTSLFANIKRVELSLYEYVSFNNQA
jgi:hypothetical protein